MFNINPKAKLKTMFTGNENSLIVIIDDFLSDTSPAIAEAQALSYITVDKSNYPGVRANVGQEYGMLVLKFLLPLFFKLYKLPQGLTLFPDDGKYSLLSVSESDLNYLQCLPHFDDSEENRFAILHYLNPGKFGGTGFYRHKPTGYERITDQRKKGYREKVRQFIDTNGQPTQKYFTYSDDHYELTDTVEYLPNRLIIYPRNILHSAFITNPEHDVNCDPKTGRLSSNFFISFTPKSA